MEKQYIKYLLLGILNWIGIIYVYKFALIGEINIKVLFIITAILVGHGIMNLKLVSEKLNNDDKG